MRVVAVVISVLGRLCRFSCIVRNIHHNKCVHRAVSVCPDLSVLRQRHRLRKPQLAVRSCTDSVARAHSVLCVGLGSQVFAGLRVWRAFRLRTRTSCHVYRNRCWLENTIPTINKILRTRLSLPSRKFLLPVLDSSGLRSSHSPHSQTLNLLVLSRE